MMEGSDGLTSPVEPGSVKSSRETELQALLVRAEAASGPDRQLDGLIEVAVRGIEAARSGLAPEHWAKWRSNKAGEVGDGYTGYRSAPVTASLDAALALVERVLPGWAWMTGCSPGSAFFAELAEMDPASNAEASAYGKTAPLAICAALLKALSHQPPRAPQEPGDKAREGEP